MSTAAASQIPPEHRPDLHLVEDGLPEVPKPPTFGAWLVYEDEKEAIREEALVLQKRLHQLRRRWRAITAAQAEAEQ